MIKLSEIFDIKYGVNLELNSLEKNDNGINFVSRTMRNNGVSSIVDKIEGLDTLIPGTITVSAGGSVLEAFLQPKEYYSGRDLYYLTPKIELTDREKIYYCVCIRANKFKYSYGRQANSTLKDLLVPSKEEIPDFVYNSKISDYLKIKKSINKEYIDLNNKKWEYFEYKDLFNLKRGKGPLANFAKNNIGKTPFISATEYNNGISYYTDYEEKHNGNVITIANNGSIGETFYQEKGFCATSDITVLIPKFNLNKYIAIFLISLIKKEKYRFNYGKKWNLEIMKNSKIKLPTNSNGSPNFEFMENYIKSLPYSNYI